MRERSGRDEKRNGHELMNIAKELQQALALHQAGKLAEAGIIYRNILKADPDNVDALNLMGVLLQSGGQLPTAIELLKKATGIAPDYLAAWVNLGNALQLTGRLDAAVDAFQKAMTLNPRQPEPANNLASALNQLKRHAEAIDACVMALKAKPDFAEAHINMGNALIGLNKPAEAEKSFRAALQLNPAISVAYFNLGNALTDQGRLEDALEAYRKSVALDAANAEKHYNHANTALKLDRFAEAEKSFRAAIEMDPDYVDAYCNLGSALQSQGRPAEAIQCYREGIERSRGRPSADLHWNLSLALLQNGDYMEGWEVYEWRWLTPTFLNFKRDWQKPEWTGGPLNGETVLIHAEQGFGDGIQFSRFAPLVAERGGRVVLECRPQLTRLFRTLAGVGECFDLGQPVPEHDFQIPLMSLPRAFKTTLETIPAKFPYLSPPPGAKVDPRITQEKGLKIGFAWAGSPTRPDNAKRSAPLKMFEPLFRVPGTRFFSLQVGKFQPELAGLDPALGVVDLAPGLADFGDTAAVIRALDLVITVDTGVLHLTGAVDRPAWGLMAQPTGFLWMVGRDDSPWYPKLKLFRQAAPGDWASVFGRVEEELRKLAGKSA
jgi:tetratricopeptide (TPR) repeat protein